MVVAAWILTVLSMFNLVGLVIVIKVLYAILETKIYIERLVNEEKWV
jgi:hypothetical protein